MKKTLTRKSLFVSCHFNSQSSHMSRSRITGLNFNRRTLRKTKYRTDNLRMKKLQKLQIQIAISTLTAG